MPADPAFDAWLRDAITVKGYDRLWVTNNLAALRKQFEENPVPLEPCPLPPSKRVRDRYEEL